MITTSTLWLDMSMGLLVAGFVLGALLLLTWWDRRRQDRAAAQLHVPQHRAGGEGGGAPLAPAPVEVIRRPFPMDEATSTIAARFAAIQAEERTEEHPALVAETPVEHLGAQVDWSPTQELALVPERPIDAMDALEADIAAEVAAEFAAVFDPIQQQIARLGHAEQHTCEISFEHVRLAVDAERAGAL